MACMCCFEGMRFTLWPQELFLFLCSRGQSLFASRRDLQALLLLAAVAVLFLAPALFTPRVLLPLDLLMPGLPWSTIVQPEQVNNVIISDLVEQALPYYEFLRSEVLQGRLPLWNPYAAAGTPFLATGVSAVFSPLQWLLLLLPASLYFEYSALLKLILAGSGIYLFCRCTGLSRSASVAAGLAYQLGGYSVFTLGYVNSNGSMLLGWGLLFVELFVRSGRRIWLVALSGILGASYLSGQMQVAFLQTLVFGLYALVRRPARLPGVFLSGILGVSLAAAAVVPFGSFLVASSQFAERASQEENPNYLPHRAWPALVIPHQQPRGDQLQKLERFKRTSYSYIGIVPLFLAVLGILARTVFPGRRALVVVAAFSLGVVLGIPILFNLFTALPLLGQGNHLHLAHVFQGTLAILAATGVDALRKREVEARSMHVVFALLLGIAAWEWFAQLGSSSGGSGHFFVNWQVPLPLYPLWAAATLGAVWMCRRRRLLPRLVCVVVLINGFAFGFFFNTALQPRLWPGAAPKWVKMVKERPHERLVALGVGIFQPNLAMLWGIRDLRGYETLTLPRWARFSSAFSEHPEDVHHYVETLDTKRLAVLKRSGCGLVLSPKRIAIPGLDLIVDEFPFLYRIAGGSRVGFAESIQPTISPEQALGFLLDGEQGGRVLVEGVSVAERGLPEGRVSWIHDLPDRLELAVEVTQPAWLVIRDSYDEAWVAEIDGEETTLYRADYLFRALRVPAGEHRVRLSYRPWSFPAGAIISLAAVAVLLLLVVWEGRSRQQSRKSI